MTKPSVDRLLTTEEAACHLGVSAVTLERWRSQRRGPRFVRYGRYLRYRLSDLEAFLEHHLVAGDSRDTRPAREEVGDAW